MQTNEISRPSSSENRLNFVNNNLLLCPRIQGQVQPTNSNHAVAIIAIENSPHSQLQTKSDMVRKNFLFLGVSETTSLSSFLLPQGFYVPTKLYDVPAEQVQSNNRAITETPLETIFARISMFLQFRVTVEALMWHWAEWKPKNWLPPLGTIGLQNLDEFSENFQKLCCRF